jgi:hypothetical protein
MDHKQIKWIYTPDEMSEAIKIQIHNRFFKLLRKLTIQNIKMKILEAELKSNSFTKTDA